MLGILKKGIEYSKELILIVLMALLFTIFVMSHNKIPSGSMISTLNIDDHIFTNMIPYYYRNPHHGEIVVFKHGSESWVKRVIGCPGDTIDLIDGNVYRNGVLLDESAYVKDATVPAYTEDAIQFPYVVPEGKYFLMGDNRPESKDSRYIGPVSRTDIYGKAWIKIYPFTDISVIK